VVRRVAEAWPGHLGGVAPPGILPTSVAGASNPFSFQASAAAWLTVALSWAAASVFLWRMRGATLEGGPESV
jgi:hypothetical protein